MIDVKRNDIEHLNVENRKNDKRSCVIFQSNLEKRKSYRGVFTIEILKTE